jgi:hypothetical protein
MRRNGDDERGSAPFRINTDGSCLAGPELEAQRPIWCLLRPLGTAPLLVFKWGVAQNGPPWLVGGTRNPSRVSTHVKEAARARAAGTPLGGEALA